MEIKLVPYHKEEETAREMIFHFHLAHNAYGPDDEAADSVLQDWTKKDDFLYFIKLDNCNVGFVHLNCAEREENWRADIFVLPEYQGKGIDTHAIQLAGDILIEHSKSGNPEAAPNVVPAYHHIGYRRLSGFPKWEGFPSKK